MPTVAPTKPTTNIAKTTASQITTKKMPVKAHTKEVTVQNGASKPANKKNPQKPNKSATSVQIDNSNINLLVEELFDSNKKLTKAQEKKKEQLEKYLLDQMQTGGSNGTSSTLESEIYDDEDETNSYSNSENEVSSKTSSEVLTKTSSSEPAAKPSKNGIKRKHDTASASTNKEEAIIETSVEAKRSKTQNVKNAETFNRKSTSSLKESKSKLQQKRSLGGTAIASDKEIKCTPHNVGADIKLEPLSPPHSIIKMNSIKEGEKMFHWLLNPVEIRDFFTKYWEKNACFIKRQHANYYSTLISFEAIDKMLLKNYIEFTKNIDVTSYENGVRMTHNPEGRAMPPVVWEHYGRGCSIRLLNPQTYLQPIYTLNASMQEYFQCMVGANVYLTPPNSQGFAPHYDDIEAFVLQVEGRKRWRLYKPRSTSEMLPRVSSKNFEQAEIGEPIMDEVLHPGDVLYFPRGVIHQACTEPGYHSLHVTISVYQKHCYADLIEHMMPMILQHAFTNNLDLRRGVPMHMWQHAGLTFSENDTRERADLLKNVSQLITKCMRDFPLNEILDASVDQMAKKYQHEALPPEIHPSESIRTIFGSRNRTNEKGECICDDYDIDLTTNVRPLRANIMRLVNEDGKLRVYYYLNNSKQYCEYEPNFLEIGPNDATIIEVLIKSYPEYVGVGQLPSDDEQHKIEVITGLFELGLVMLEKPIK
ncbi:bifunctional lysine-specific demethylase and histidyl-hydroxylase NO66-like [Teleopsis dalmanni]|uniref:bifunctional lysine-specific demethylase and histidyl-hydroxylase NO66-like n=1 Tax=Teleopsis dalmanni TaxID=139649 RepID=UPI000D32AF4F|nr:bifunctional lysine-specific demethylase and histidyl-hydroxylase NO66-like [Teleopsis dalmanni]